MICEIRLKVNFQVGSGFWVLGSGFWKCWNPEFLSVGGASGPRPGVAPIASGRLASAPTVPVTRLVGLSSRVASPVFPHQPISFQKLDQLLHVLLVVIDKRRDSNSALSPPDQDSGCCELIREPLPPFAAERHVAGVTPGISRSDYIETKFLEALPNQGGQAEDMIVHLFAARCLEVAESVYKGVKYSQLPPRTANLQPVTSDYRPRAKIPTSRASVGV